jgi:hypothetical protein
VSHDQFVAGSLQQPRNGPLDFFRRQWRLGWPIVEVGHFTFRTKSHQSRAESRGTIGIIRPAQSDDAPSQPRMGQDEAAAPESFVVRMSNDDRGSGTASGYGSRREVATPSPPGLG